MNRKQKWMTTSARSTKRLGGAAAGAYLVLAGAAGCEAPNDSGAGPLENSIATVEQALHNGILDDQNNYPYVGIVLGRCAGTLITRSGF